MAVGWAEFILYIVFAAGTATSLFAFFWGRRLRKLGSAPRAVRDDPAFKEILEGGWTIAGETEPAAPSSKALLDVLALQLENPNNFTHVSWGGVGWRAGPLHVERTSDNELSFHAEGLNVSQGLVRAEAGQAGGTVRVRWAVRVSGFRTLVTMGQAWALFLGLPASVAGPALIFIYVLGSTSPAVAAQFLQILQVAQLLWEPYLFIGIAWQEMKATGRRLDMLVATAAFEARTGRAAVQQGNRIES
ncbi:MAG: hypothetical protein ABSE73_20600 [Planctomycetota bacterium]